MTTSSSTATAGRAGDVSGASPSPATVDSRFLVVRTFAPVWVVLAAVTVAALFGAVPPTDVGFALVLVSVLVFGLPHGAVDHLFVARLVADAAADSGVSVRGHPYLAVVVVYLVLGGAYLLGWFVAPVASFVFFILLTWLHWGLGDLYALLAVGGGHVLETRGQRALTAAIRGAIPMLVPFVVHPVEYRRVAELVVGAFDPTATATLAALFVQPARLAVGAGFALAVTVSFVLGAVRTTSWRRWAVDVGETLLLVAFFVAIPPVVAIGLYFPLWHSVRHILRVELLDETAAEGFRAGRLRPALVGFARDAAPLTLASLVIFAGLFVAAPAATATLQGAVAIYLVLLAVLTLPHATIAVWADVRQGVWRV